ncbi:MAG: flavin reductase family protein [Hyphomicrobiaceae bacterium]
MHYDAIANTHGLRHDPLKALVVPRPIGWISSLAAGGGVNLAPYSFFNAVGDRPGYVVVGSGGPKDTLRNIADTGEFVCSLATWDLREAMNMTSAPVARGVDEFRIAGVTPAASRFVKPPRVKESPAALECRHWQTLDLPGGTPEAPSTYALIIGIVVGVYVDDAYVHGGIVDTGAMRPIARLGYKDYAVVTPETMFAMDRPSAEAGLALLREAPGAA